MRTRLAGVQLCVHTNDGTVGRTLTLSPGLNLVRGGNSRGRTHLVSAVIYALGLERILTARAGAPLGMAFSGTVRLERDGVEVVRPVTSSWVAVELVNAAGAVLTAQRHITHAQRRRDQVRVWYRPAVTSPDGAGPDREYPLSTSDTGFHAALARFLSWAPPAVSAFDGRQTRLPIDVMFPFLIADQHSARSSSPRRLERSRLREPGRHAASFLLALNAPTAAYRLWQLEQELRARLGALPGVRIDPGTLRPTGPSTADDATRVTVAYLDAVRAIGSTDGPHPGLLILDELGEDGWPASVLRYLARSSVDGRQTVVRTSASRADLERVLAAVPATVVDLGDGRLLQPTSPPPAFDRLDRT